MNIREINEKELFSLLELYTQLHNNPMPEKSKDLLELWNNILHDKHQHIIVAIEDARIVSSCALIIVPNFTHNQRPYAF